MCLWTKSVKLTGLQHPQAVCEILKEVSVSVIFLSTPFYNVERISHSNFIVNSQQTTEETQQQTNTILLVIEGWCCIVDYPCIGFVLALDRARSLCQETGELACKTAKRKSAISGSGLWPLLSTQVCGDIDFEGGSAALCR